MHVTYDTPYPSKRQPVMAHNIVSTSQPLAAQAGLQMLQKGGNAVDAAIATAVCLTVVEPTMNGLGSNAFALVWDGCGLTGINGSGRAPSALDPSKFLDMDKMPVMGWDAVTVPGAVSVWAALHGKFGCLEFEDLFEPAINYARDGFPVAPVTAEMWARAQGKYGMFPEFGRSFLLDGQAPLAGEKWTQYDQAKSLSLIARSKGEDLYKGELAERIIAHSEETGGYLTMDDLSSHNAEWTDPISVNYRDHTVHELPPNGQGIAALMALGILDNLELEELDGPLTTHLQIEAMKLAFADVHAHVGDPEWMKVKQEDLLDPGYLADRAKLIDPDRAQLFGPSALGQGDTVFLTTADADGMMVSFIQSNYMGFGSGIVVPGTGISLQNRGACFSTAEGHPNQVEGGKRPFHTIIPAFMSKDGEPVMSFGVMGGPFQPQGHVQMVTRMVDYQQNPQAAADAPRWQVFDGAELGVEEGFDQQLLNELLCKDHCLAEKREYFWYGGAQLIMRLEDGYCAGSDPRKDGQAVGF